MVVAVVAVRVVQVPVHEVVHVVAVRHGLVPATRSVNVTRIMTAALVCRRALVGIGIAHLDSMLDHGPVVGDMMQVPVVQVVDMVAVPDTGVLAIRTVLVIMVFVSLAHLFLLGIGLVIQDSSMACMTPLVTKREMCPSAKR